MGAGLLGIDDEAPFENEKDTSTARKWGIFLLWPLYQAAAGLLMLFFLYEEYLMKYEDDLRSHLSEFGTYLSRCYRSCCERLRKKKPPTKPEE
jgi:hypothetical protein